MKKKILLLLPSYSSYFAPTVEYFKKNKWEIKTYDYRHGSYKVRIVHHLPLFGGLDTVNTRIADEIIEVVKRFRPELILTYKGESISPLLLQELKKYNVKTVNWFPDPINHWKLILKIAPHYDYFFIFDPLILQKLRQKGLKNIFYLPFGSEIEEKKDVKKIYEVSFIGTFTNFREKWLMQLKDVNLNIWGDPRWFKSKLKEKTRGGRISQEEMKQKIKQSKINLNLYYDFYTEGVNLRAFEVTGSGGFLLSQNVKDLKNLFVPGQEVVVCSNPQQMEKTISYYLEHEDQIKRVEQAGYQRARRDHRYEKRFKQMLTQIYER